VRGRSAHLCKAAAAAAVADDEKSASATACGDTAPPQDVEGSEVCAAE